MYDLKQINYNEISTRSVLRLYNWLRTMLVCSNLEVRITPFPYVTICTIQLLPQYALRSLVIITYTMFLWKNNKFDVPPTYVQ